MEYWSTIVEGLNAFPCRVRVAAITVRRPQEWSSWIIVPTDGYVEAAEIGPVSMQDIEYVEIETIERRYRGRLVSEEIIDLRQEVVNKLRGLGARFEEQDNVIRVLPNKANPSFNGTRLRRAR